MQPSPAIARFLADLFGAPTHEMRDVFDPWNGQSDDDLQQTGAADRRDRLRSHLCAPNPRLLLVGEAPGYQGARISGSAFTSEALLLEGAIPRAPQCGRLSSRRLPWREPSATIVWGALYRAGVAEHTLLWNAFPWHPYRSGNKLSNRAPTTTEKAAGLPLLKMLVEALPGVTVAAVGQVAGASLRQSGLDAPTLRHPAMAGATAFREGLAALAARL